MSYSRRELYALGEPLGESVTIKKVGGGYVCGGGGSGGGGQTQSTGTTYQTNIPAYLEDPTKNMVARGELLSNQPYLPYSGQRVAGLTPQQQAVYGQIGSMGTPSEFGQAGATLTGAEQFGAAGALGAMGYQPSQFNAYQMSGPGNIGAQNVYGTGYDAYGVAAAPDVTGTSYDAAMAQYAPQVQGTGYNAVGVEAAPDVAAQALQYFQMAGPESWTEAGTQSKYMSPYQQAVTDIAKREAAADAALLNKQLSSQAAKAGAFGGSRFGVEQALLGSKLAQNLTDIQTKGSEAAYQAGLGQFNTEQAARQAAGVQNLQAALGVQSLGAGQNLQAQLANQANRQQANMASQAAYNQALQFGATQEQAAQLANQAAFQQTSLANQAALNQAGQFGASQSQAAALANQQARQQANLASQSAYNQALQFGATQEQAAQIANQQANLTAAQTNQSMAYNVGLQNLQSALTTQQQQDAARQAAAQLNLQGAQFGAQTGLSAAQQRAALGTATQTADLQRLAAQESAGKAQQDQQQAELNAAYNTFLEQRDWEKNQLGFLSGLIRGTPFSTSQTGTTTAPAPSTTSQLAGLGIAGVGLANLLK